MGFFSSLFGTSKSTSPSSTVVQSTSIPKEIAPFLTETLEGYQDLYKNQLERGYQDYTGDTIAPLTQSQEQALTGLEGLRGTTQPFYQTATDRAVGAGASFTPEAAQQYMSPYQQAVTDIEKREAQRNFEGNVLPRLEAQAVGAGAMSGLGSRAGVEMAEAQRNQSQLLADIQAKGQQRAFDAASKQFEAERTRERGVGQDLGQLAGQSLTSNISEIGAQKAAGEERQNLTQLGLDEAYRKFLEREEFPETTLATYSGGIYGNPLSRTFDQTTNTFGAQPSTGQSLLSLGLGGLGLYGMGKNIFSKEGGYINEQLPVIERADSGPANNDGLALVETGKNIFQQIREALTPTEEQRKKLQARNLRDMKKIPGLTMMGPAPVVSEQVVSPEAANILRQLGQTTKGKLNLLETVEEKKERESLTEDLQNELNKIIEKEEEQINITEGSKYTTADELPQDERQGIIDFYTQKQNPNNPISVPVATPPSAETGKFDTDKPKKKSITDNTMIADYFKSNKNLQDMVNKKIISMGELQTQLKDAIKADKTGTKESRDRRNELSFWKSLLVAGEAVGAADPTKGFLNALSKGVSAGGKSVVDARMKLEEEAKGDGKKAIDAIKTLMSIETADLKLQQISTASSGEMVKTLSAWAKANNLKNQGVKKYAEITKTATAIAKEAMAEGSEGYDKYVKKMILEAVLELDRSNDLGKSLRVLARVQKPTTEAGSNQGASEGNEVGSKRKPASSVKRIGTFDPRPKD